MNRRVLESRYFTMSRCLLLMMALSLGACALDPPAPEPEPPLQLPAQWQSVGQRVVPADSSVDWRDSLNDPQLETLIVRALTGNFDLAAAAARVRAARAQARIAGAPRWPQAELSVDASRSRRSSASGFTLASPVNDSRTATLDLSWELDLWGRLARQDRAASFDAEAAAGDYAAARLSLAGNVAAAWFDAIHARRQLVLAEETAQSYQQHRDTIHERVRGGLNPVLDLRLIRAQLASAESAVAEQERVYAAARRRLETLLGQYPAGAIRIAAELPAPGPLPEPGLPLQLLERRPDLRAARARLLARQDDAAAASRNLLPQLLLSGSGGRSGTEFQNLFDADFLVWSIAGALSQPLFRGGRLAAEREFADAELQRAVQDYAGATLLALEEVEAALSAESLLMRREQALRVSRDEAEIAEQLALEQYSSGLADVITLLESERRLLDARRNLLSLRNERLQNRIRLHLALGGSLHDAAAQTVSISEHK